MELVSHANLIHFECQNCGACCSQSNLLVTVTGKDIMRIAAALDIGPDDLLHILDFYVVDENTPLPKGMRDIPPIMTEKGLAYVALRKFEDGSCIFLEDNKCMIYPVRPAVCKAFPFTFKIADGGLNWGISAMSHICPGIGEGPLVKESSLLTLGKAIIAELSYYAEFVKNWNETVPSPTVETYLRVLFDSMSRVASDSR